MRLLRLIAAATCGAALLATACSVPAAPRSGNEVAHSFLDVASASATTDAEGLGPDDIASAYALSGGSTGTVAVVTAYSNPTLEADLGVYRANYGLPAMSTAAGNLTIVDQDQATSPLPTTPASGETAADVTSWGEETSLDVDAVSAACPDCSILVVEAKSDSMSNLGAAVNTAVAMHATAVSASWGDSEWSSWKTISDEYFTHPGVPIVAAAGDSGYGDAVIPAVLPNVIAVGGTTLTGTGAGTALRTYDVVGGSVTAATSTATIAADKKALAKAKAAYAASRKRVTTITHRLHAAKAKQKHAATAHLRLHWKHRAAALTKALRTAEKARTAAAHRVKAASSKLAADLLCSSGTSTTAARAGQASRSGWIETAWNQAGSGCSDYVPHQSWQPTTACAKRGVSDISADADPDTGLSVYDSSAPASDTGTGWLVAGGTSLAAPLIAGMLVRSGHAASYSTAQPLYEDSSAFWDVTSGSNGVCTKAALCTAGTGYDGPTGIGTPKSLSSF